MMKKDLVRNSWAMLGMVLLLPTLALARDNKNTSPVTPATPATPASDVASKADVDATADGGVQYMGLSAPPQTGDLGGVPGANAKCDSLFTGSHFCTTTDIVRASTTTLEEGWVLYSGPVFYKDNKFISIKDTLGPNSILSRARKATNCNGWASGGAYYVLDGQKHLNYGTVIGGSTQHAVECTSLRGIHCCK